MNWKLRFKNKVTFLALAAAVVGFVYQVLGIFGVTAPITQDTVKQLIGLVVNILVAVGVMVDPTTPGITDSKRAMEYAEPGQTLDPDYTGPADLTDEKGE